MSPYFLVVRRSSGKRMLPLEQALLVRFLLVDVEYLLDASDWLWSLSC